MGLLSAGFARSIDVHKIRGLPRWLILAMGVATSLSGCAALGELRNLVQPPRFEQAEDRPAEIALQQPSRDRPLGGAVVRMWAQVSNPNPFGFTITTLDTTLFLEGQRAAKGDFPLGLPLRAREESVIPLELTIDFSDLPGLAAVIRQAARSEGVAYRLDGTIGIDAGALGQPTFGPLSLMRGELAGRLE
jgi:hypothetical protein